jgi:hypothetical protein
MKPEGQAACLRQAIPGGTRAGTWFAIEDVPSMVDLLMTFSIFFDSTVQRVRHLLVATGLTAFTACAAAAPAVALSDDARAVVVQAMRSNDHRGAPFMVLDKRAARLWVFDSRARLQGSTPVLLGMAIGDDTVPGIGDLPLSQIADAARTTPAGRFVLEPGRNLHGDYILWIDYAAAVSMHRVRSVNAGERRLQRLASPRAADRRISYGCINVPVAFFDRVLLPFFTETRAIAYVLPESQPLAAVFPFMAAPTPMAESP